DMVRRLGYLCQLWPDARTLIVADSEFGATLLYEDLEWYLGESLGVLARGEGWPGTRRMLAGQWWLPRLRLRAWQVVVLVIHSRRHVREATSRALVAGRAPRVYAFTWRHLRLAKRTRIRLEAMAGPVIDPPGV